MIHVCDCVRGKVIVVPVLVMVDTPVIVDEFTTLVVVVTVTVFVEILLIKSC